MGTWHEKWVMSSLPDGVSMVVGAGCVSCGSRAGPLDLREVLHPDCAAEAALQ